LAYILNSENSLEIIENLQEIELKDRREPFLFEIENILKERIEEIKSGKDLSKIDSFIETLSKYLKEKDAIFQRKEGGVKNFITDLFNELVQKSSQK
jgi:2-hydroxy-3-keto-5-methylthiopentenyl-1-phosphate phosphatase